ncbi:HD domain-containing protein [Rhizobium leguminosarum]|uniref:HD domain-containing protein n=1 Tax=Rhizobium leguminosarum TaxID=384 RepID=UPI0003FD9ECC|nr:HD domain-containing protein [Rhizobium leguminosarum]
MSTLEIRLEAFVKTCVGIDPAHDLLHVKRVVGSAKAFAAEEEEPARQDVLIAASWLHDVIRREKDGGMRAPSSVHSASLAAEFLREEQLFDDADIERVYHAIAAHSYTAGIPPETIEAKILHDADRIDALGAIGIARCMIVGGRFGAALYHEGEPIPEARDIDDRKFIVDHFYNRLFKLEDTFLTKAGSREAAHRTRYMRSYIEELEREMPETRLS